MHSRKITISPEASEKIRQIAAIADEMPGVVVIHNLPDFSLLYMSRLGLRLLHVEWSEIDGMSSEEYHKRFFNEEHANDYVPKIINLISANSDEVISYFQQVRTSPGKEWEWYMSMTRILFRDKNGAPSLSITIAMKIDPAHFFTSKANRLLEENSFLKKNYDKFVTLTNREKDVLRLMAMGKNTTQLAAALHISTTTVETHRKRIRQKLKVSGTSLELIKYAEAFNLV